MKKTKSISKLKLQCYNFVCVLFSHTIFPVFFLDFLLIFRFEFVYMFRTMWLTWTNFYIQIYIYIHIYMYNTHTPTSL